MKTLESIRIQNQNFVEAFVRRKRLITFTELLIFILIGFALLCTSCSPILYSTVGQNVGLFHQKGEVSLSGNLSSTDNASGVGLQFAAAVDSSAEIMASYYSLNNETSTGDYIELGAGKFKYYPTNKFCGELILGLGFGSINNLIRNVNSSNYTVDANYFKPFLQPSFGFSDKIVDIAFTPRIAFVSYTSKTNNASDPSMHASITDYFSVKQNTFVFEPGITFRIGYKNVKFQIQYNHSSFNYSSTDNFSPVDKDFISVGLHVLFSNHWASKPKY